MNKTLPGSNALSSNALINRSVTDLRHDQNNHSERTSQALLGESVQLLEEGPEWCRVRLDHDSYEGWLHTAALIITSPAKIQQFQASCNACISADILVATWAPGQPLIPHPNTDFNTSGKLPFGVRVSVIDWSDEIATIRLPDDRLWQVSSKGILPFDQLPSPNPLGIQFTLNLIRRFVGVPYLWGGRTPFGYDCSGLAQAFLHFLGINSPRDADQQYEACQPVHGAPQPGDLLFFGDVDDPTNQRLAHVTHVAISLGDDEIIHANGAAWSVSYNSLSPQKPLYRSWLREHLIGVGRFW
jgi:hypothetical protein